MATSLEALQLQVDAWAQRYWSGEYWPPMNNFARLTEEVGELARALNQHHGPKRIKQDEAAAEIGAELADVLFALVCIANSTGVDLQDAWDATLDKYRVRDEEPRDG